MVHPDFCKMIWSKTPPQKSYMFTHKEIIVYLLIGLHGAIMKNLVAGQNEVSVKFSDSCLSPETY